MSATSFWKFAQVPVESDPAATSDAALIEPLKPAFYDENAASAPAYVRTLASWLRRYVARVQSDNAPANTRAERMNRVNPKYVLRNHLAQVAIEKSSKNKDFSEIDRLLAVLRRPFDEQPEFDSYAEPPPDWAKDIAVSCSS